MRRPFYTLVSRRQRRPPAREIYTKGSDRQAGLQGLKEPHVRFLGWLYLCFSDLFCIAFRFRHQLKRQCVQLVVGLIQAPHDDQVAHAAQGKGRYQYVFSCMTHDFWFVSG